MQGTRRIIGEGRVDGKNRRLSVVRGRVTIGSRSNFVGVLLLIRNARSREMYDVDGITNGSSCYSHREK